jgi:hypothetical protein
MEKGLRMERRAASHTEEEEMNQRRRLLNQARKGDVKAINKLFELYQVRVYSGEMLNKVGRLPFGPVMHEKAAPRRVTKVTKRTARRKQTSLRRKMTRKISRKAARRKIGTR